MDVKLALDDIDDVLAWCASRGTGEVPYETAVTRMKACIVRCSPRGSEYRARVESLHRNDDVLSVIEGSLRALRMDLDKGRLASFEELIHADVYSDLLSQGEGLLRDGYARASMVVAGAALEEHIKALAVRNSISLVHNGQPKKASVMSSELKAAGLYNEAQRAIVEGWQKLRNDAAHGNPGFDGADRSHVTNIKPAIDGIRAFIVQYPA